MINAQDFLSYASEFVLVGSIALYGSLFIHGLMARRRVSPGQLELDFSAVLTDAEVEELQEQPIAPVEPEQPKFWESAIVPFKRPVRQLPDLTSLSIRQLKKLASERKIKRYNIMTKSQLVEAIAAA